MPVNIIVPPLSQTMDSLVLVAWVKKVGDQVVKGETLYQVETDKATLEVESPASGVLSEILAEPGDEVLVKSKIGTISLKEDASETNKPEKTAATPASGSGSTEIEKRGEAAASRQNSTETARRHGAGEFAGRSGRIFASPRARNLAKAEGVPLEALKASGPQGMIVERDVRAFLKVSPGANAASRGRVTPLAKRMAAAEGIDLSTLAGRPEETMSQAASGSVIRRADVEAALQKNLLEEKASQAVSFTSPAALPGKGKPVALSSLRKTIARRMHASHITTAPVTITREVDATRLVNLRADILKELAKNDIRPTYTDFLMVIVTRILGQHPSLNALFDGETLEMYDEVHMGLAIDTDRGLLAPVIHDTANKGLHQLALERQRLAKLASDGNLSQEDLNGGTFTITNLGSLGIDGFTPVINLPQVAILGIGRIRPAPAVFEDQVAIRQLMVLSLTFDHRAIDGAPAARFLHDIAQLVEKPQLVWL